LKRVFNIDIETCDKCGGDVRIIASIEDPAVIGMILAHLNENVASVAAGLLRNAVTAGTHQSHCPFELMSPTISLTYRFQPGSGRAFFVPANKLA